MAAFFCLCVSVWVCLRVCVCVCVCDRTSTFQAETKSFFTQNNGSPTERQRHEMQLSASHSINNPLWKIIQLCSLF